MISSKEINNKKINNSIIMICCNCFRIIINILLVYQVG